MRIATLCDTLGCLPNPGGLLDQHPAHIARLERIYKARADWEKAELDKPAVQQDDLKARAAALEHTTDDLEEPTLI